MNAELRAQKARGAFFTPPQVSQFLVDWAIRGPKDIVLEPSCGDAAFLMPAAARLQQLGAASLTNQVHGIDIHAPSVVAAQALLAEQGLSATVTCSDFFDIDPQRRFDAVIGNPPYVRYQDFTGAARTKSLKAALAHGVRLTSLASSWAAFTIHASSFLTDEGRLALVLPAELLSVKYASEVRRFLLERFAKVKLVLFEQLIFPGVLEEVVLILAEGRGKSKHFEVYQSRDAEGLLKLDTSVQQEFAPVDNEKWTPALIPANALETYRQITSASATFAKLIDWGETYLGSVTGNNDYFTFNAEGLKASGLRESEVLKISPPGSRHLRGLTFTTAAWEQQVRDGARCFLFAPSDKPSKAALAYISKGEKSNVHKAYKCTVRDPWWRVPLVDQPDLLFTYMNHDRPRLISNEAQALVLNSLYGVKLKKGMKSVGKTALPIACMNTVTLIGSEVVGRAYGGGLLKHEPREADLLPVPSPAMLSEAQNDLQLLKPQLTIAMRKNDISRAVELVDEVILVKHLRLGKTEVQQLRAAREGLFSRRRARGKATRGED